MKKFNAIFILILSQCLALHSQVWQLKNADTLNDVEGHYNLKSTWSDTISPGSRDRGFSWVNTDGDFCLYGGLQNNIWCYRQGQWKWLWGNAGTFQNNKANFFRYQEYHPDNKPGIRSGSPYPKFCDDHKGGFYLYGGFGQGKDKQQGLLDDLWHWNGKEWGWLWGGDRNQEPVYGKQGLFNDKNTPGSRQDATIWADKQGLLWLYGGYARKRDSNNVLRNIYKSDWWCFNGSQWAWVGGDSLTDGNGQWLEKGKFHPNNRPPAMSFGLSTTNDQGIFFGYTGGSYSYYTKLDIESQKHGQLWCFNGKEWALLSGDSVSWSSTARHNGLGKANEQNTPGFRQGSRFFYNVANQTIDLIGGAYYDSTTYGFNFRNDWWSWTDSGWLCRSLGNGTNYPKFGGKQLQPGARVNALYWLDRHGDYWQYGGAGLKFLHDTFINTDTSILHIDSIGEYADLWKLQLADSFVRFELFFDTIQIQNDANPIKSITHFGNRSITQTTLWRRFQLVNRGNVATNLDTDLFSWAKKASSFLVKHSTLPTKLEADDSFSFWIGFQPNQEGFIEETLQIYGEDSLLINFIGKGTSADITVLRSNSCTEATLLIAKLPAAFYTVLISTDSIYDNWLKDGENYHYSPNYLLANEAWPGVKILHQEANNKVKIQNLVSNRNYTLWVVPGSGPAGNTHYDIDSASLLSYKIAKSPYQDSISIFPNADTGYCKGFEEDFIATSPFAVQWHDGIKDQQHPFVPDIPHYFTAASPDACLLSSDTVSATRYLLPPKPTIQSSSLPWCKGDTVELVLLSANSFWTKSKKADTLLVQENGWQVAMTQTQHGCTSIDSLLVRFSPKPKITVDKINTLRAIDGKLELDFMVNEGEYVWVYNNDSFAQLNEIDFKDTAKLILLAKNKGCHTTWKGTVANLESVWQQVNAFSPNGDGVNDVFFPVSPRELSGELVIFDRWGGTIYRSSEPWYGTKNGVDLPSGTYQFSFFPDKGELMFGLVTLIR